MSEKGRLFPRHLSTGEQQRVGIARAVVNRPRIILADEPTGNLDPYLSRQVMSLFHQFCDLGSTVLVASHDIDLIKDQGCRILHLSQGALVQDTVGSPEVFHVMVRDTKTQDARGVESPLTVDRPKVGRLRAWFADHGRVVSDTSLFVSQRLMSSFLVWLMIGVALTLPGLLWIAQSNAQAFSQQWPGSAGLTVYMKLAASEPVIEDMEGRLKREAGVERVILTTPDQALQELLEQSGESAFLRDAMAAVGSNPLPASYAVVLNDRSSYLQPDALRRKLLAETGVDDVVIEMTWLEQP